MNRVRRLKTNIINNIAAGEIIESPSSVVKELIENSIDANSKEITVIVEDYGLKNIVVKDDGLGMPKEDFKLAFNRHTTSKISSKIYLQRIKTLGFRGEALPSIASVSMLSSLSKNKTNNAHEIKIHAGELKSFKEGVCNKGTSIKVENLFYNLPARKIIHTVGPVWSGGDNDEYELLSRCYTSSLRIAVTNNICTIAFPAISTGAFKFPLRPATRIAINTVAVFLEGTNRISQVFFSCYDHTSLNSYRAAIKEYFK